MRAAAINVFMTGDPDYFFKDSRMALSRRRRRFAPCRRLLGGSLGLCFRIASHFANRLLDGPFNPMAAPSTRSLSISVLRSCPWQHRLALVFQRRAIAGIASELFLGSACPQCPFRDPQASGPGITGHRQFSGPRRLENWQAAFFRIHFSRTCSSSEGPARSLAPSNLWLQVLVHTLFTKLVDGRFFTAMSPTGDLFT